MTASTAASTTTVDDPRDPVATMPTPQRTPTDHRKKNATDERNERDERVARVRTWRIITREKKNKNSMEDKWKEGRKVGSVGG